jgi:hypothetical protein
MPRIQCFDYNLLFEPLYDINIDPKYQQNIIN